MNWLDKIFSEIDPNLVDSNQKFGFRTNLEELSLKFQRVRLNLGELDQKFGGVRQNLSPELDAKFRKQNPDKGQSSVFKKLRHSCVNSLPKTPYSFVASMRLFIT